MIRVVCTNCKTDKILVEISESPLPERKFSRKMRLRVVFKCKKCGNARIEDT